MLSLTFFLANCSSISLFSLLPNCILIHGSICQILTSSCSILCFYQPGWKASPMAYILAWCLASSLIKAVGPVMWYLWPFGFGLALFQLPHGSVLLSVFSKTDSYLLSVRSPYLSGTSIFVRILFLRCPCRSQERVGNISFHWSADWGGVGVGPFETLDLCFKGIKIWSRRLLQLVCQIYRYFGSREWFSLCKASHACCTPV